MGSSTTLIIGDLHGRFDKLTPHLDTLLRTYDVDEIIQVGDFGFFPILSKQQPPYYDIPTYWIDGNHENHDLIHRGVGDWEDWLNGWEYIPRGTVRDGVLYMGGAYSIDKDMRKLGVSYFTQEEITGHEYHKAIDTVKASQRPVEIVISHSAPRYLTELNKRLRFRLDTHTSAYLEMIRDEVKPKYWFHGHFHMCHEEEYGGTIFRCLDMLRREGALDFVLLERDR